MSQTISVISRSGVYYFFTRIKIVTRVLACARAIASIKWRRLNTNTEKEQIEILSDLFALLTTFNINPNKHLIVAGDFNLLFN